MRNIAAFSIFPQPYRFKYIGSNKGEKAGVGQASSAKTAFSLVATLALFECDFKLQSHTYSLLSTFTNAPPKMTTPAPAQQGPKTLASSTSLQQQRLSQQPAQQHAGLRTPSNRKTIYDRNLNRTRTAELSRASFAYLFGEMVGYAQKRVTGIQDLERRYALQFPRSSIAYRMIKRTRLNTIIHITDSTKQATLSASDSCPSYSSVPRPRLTHHHDPLASCLSSNSSLTLFGGTFLRGPPTRLNPPARIIANT